MTEANKAYTEVKRPSVAPLPHPTTAVLSSNTFLETATACIDNKLNVDTIYLNTSGQGFRQSPTQTFFFLLGLRLLFELTMLISLFYLHIIISMINISKTGYPSVFWLHVKKYISYSYNYSYSLVLKLKSRGIDGLVCNLITAWLTYRQQRVSWWFRYRVESHRNRYWVQSFFLIFIND